MPSGNDEFRKELGQQQQVPADYNRLPSELAEIGDLTTLKDAHAATAAHHDTTCQWTSRFTRD
ncbi:MAG: hypothetical protein GVY13_14985 [Alphaproteobacteria bacterium]|jgi:hypothetical protein|nr:hypothetical protein [Alphaproteobacteria bacterium]